MWCSNCQQDVPGIASDGQICCARCGGKLRSGADPNVAVSDERAASGRGPAPDTPPVDLDNWEFDQDLRSAARLIRSLRLTGDIDREPAVSPSLLSDSLTGAPLVDAPHAAVPSWHARPTQGEAQRPRRKRRGAFFSWAMLSLGLMTFVCGAVLVGWSFFGGRSELWGLGLPLVLVGQAALIVGLVFQLDGLWQSNRETSRTLDELDDQLHDLRHATTLLNTAHSGGARSFYAHLAEGASPQLLLADLKGQMDLLAMRLAQERHSRSA
jgi:hypothetical protein